MPATKSIKKTVKKRKSIKSKIKPSPKTIYIQIASYRDPELLPTLRDCIANADKPKNLVFGIAWQHSPYEQWDNLDEFTDDPRFKIIDIDYRDAKGPCWARHLLNNNYDGESYMMQLDSHHRFVKGWDTIVITMLEKLRTADCPKPLLSSYLPSYDPANDPGARIQSPWVMEFDRFAPEGPVHFLPHTIDDFNQRTSPVPSRFISGHFIFADGVFCTEVPYDPTYYFHGEEINLSVRAYMAGYDLFAPHRVFMWHEYTRNGKKKHWDDHKDWAERDKLSHKHNRELLGIDEKIDDKVLKKHRRTLRDYEKYAGLEFNTRRAHKDTIEKKLPPVAVDDISFKSGLVNYHKICIDIYKEQLNETDYNCFAVAFEDENGVEIYRQDATADEIRQILSVPFEEDFFAHIWRNFHSEKKPAMWIVWPHSESKGWMERLTGQLGY